MLLKRAIALSVHGGAIVATAFERAAMAASVAIDRVNGERLRLSPMRRTDYGASPDPDRPSRNIVGAFHQAPDRMQIDRNHVGREFNKRIVTPRLTFSIDRDQLNGAIFAIGDRIVRLDQPGEPVFEVTAVDPAGPQRLIFNVVVVP